MITEDRKVALDYTLAYLDYINIWFTLGGNKAPWIPDEGDFNRMVGNFEYLLTTNELPRTK